MGNSAVSETVFGLDADFDPPTFGWVDSSPVTIKSADFPRAISITPFRWSDIKDIKIQLTGNGQNKLIYTYDHNDQLLVDKLNFIWKNSPGAGNYTLTGTMTDTNGRVEIKTLDLNVE